jgi:hypothetical protein
MRYINNGVSESEPVLATQCWNFQLPIASKTTFVIIEASFLSSINRYAISAAALWKLGKQKLGRIGMANAPERMQKRHVREKATIDHLVQDVYRPKRADEKRSGHSPTTSSGLPVEDQVRKEWDPRKGGLPTF